MISRMDNLQSIKNLQTEKEFSSGVYSKRDLTIVRGEGAFLYDDQGMAYIDCVGGQGASNLGHAHPAIVSAITRQAQQLISCPEMFYNPVRGGLMDRLIDIAPPGINRVFLCNSGTEAVEAALKFARFTTKRTEIIAAMRGFHGRTMGALSATWNKKFRMPFAPLVPGISHVPYNRLDKLEESINEDTAAVILEVVQGEGGVHLGTEEYLLGAQKICRDRGALLIIDEVQTGFGRTGKMFALEHYGLEPDLIPIAKSMGGGVPIGGVLIGSRVGELPPGIHGSTFGGNPLSAAAACAAIDILNEEVFLERVQSLGDEFHARLRELNSPLIREVRGLGLMVGIEIKQKVAPYLKELAARGVLAFSAGLTVIRLLPPLVIRQEELRVVENTLDEVLVP